MRLSNIDWLQSTSLFRYYTVAQRHLAEPDILLPAWFLLEYSIQYSDWYSGLQN